MRLSEHAKGTTPYIVAPSVVSSFRGTCAAGTLTGKAETFYDGATTQAANVPTRGLVTKELSYSTASASTTSTAAYDGRGRITDAWTPLDQGSSTPSVHWDYALASDGTHKTTITRPLGQVSATWTDAARGNVVRVKGVTDADWTHYKYDALGLLVAGWAPAQWGQASAPSLATTTPTALFVYDVTTSGPTIRTKPVVVTSAQFVKDNGTVYTGHELTSTVHRSYTFLDGWGRTLETHVPAADGTGGQTVTATHYNALGQTDWTSAPFWNSATASVLKLDPASGLMKSALVNPAPADLDSYTLTSYDTRGRSVAQSLASHGSVVSLGGVAETTATAYAGPTTTTIAPDLSSTSSTSDVLGRMISQKQCPTGSGASCTAAAGITTTYAYATLTDAGKVGFSRTTVTDAEGHATLFESNLAGQRTHMVDPAAGASDYTYDANGQTTAVTSAAGTIAMAYDDLGRMTERTSTVAGTGATSSSAAWDYVTPGEPGAATDLGLLRSSSSTTVTPLGDFTTTSSVAYDDLHQPVSSTVTLPDSPEGTTLMGDLSGLDYTTGVSYDALGQVTSTEMPAVGGLPNETSVVGYRLSGQAQTLTLAGVGFSTPLVTGAWLLGNGLYDIRAYGNGAYRETERDEVTRQVSALYAGIWDAATESGSDFQHNVYTRDAVGRITKDASIIPDAVTGDVTGQCYAYDGFNRLASAWMIAGDGATGACGASAPTSDTDPEWDASATAYATSWTYSPSGKIESIINGAANPVEAMLTYGQGGAPASGVTTMSDGTTTNTYAYDGAGRQTTRTIDGVATTLAWDVSSNLVETSGAGGDLLYVYDASGQRVAKIQVPNAGSAVTGAVTGYLGSTELADADTSVNAANPADLEGAGFITGTRYYAFGGATVAVRQVTAGEGATIPEPDPTPSPTSSPTPSPTPSASPSASPSPSPSMSPSVSPSATPSASPSPSVSPSVSPTPSVTPSPTPSPSPSEPPASPTEATSTLSLLFGDEQGSAQVMMQVTLDASGAMAPAEVTDPISRNAYTPYGAVRGADNLTIEHGWLNQVSDEHSTGLAYLNARYYDSGTSRFVSPDPLMNPTDPKTLDAFRYAENNPVTYIDATGLCSTTGNWAYVGGVLEPPCNTSNYAPGAAPSYAQVRPPTSPDRQHGDSGYALTAPLSTVIADFTGAPSVADGYRDPTDANDLRECWRTGECAGFHLRFDGDDDFTKELRRHSFFSRDLPMDVVHDVLDRGQGPRSRVRHDFSVEGPGKFFTFTGDLFAWGTNGLGGNLSTAFLGSARVDVLIEGIGTYQDTDLQYVDYVVRVRNTTGKQSGGRIPGTDFSIFGADTETGWGATFQQTIVWEERVPLVPWDTILDPLEDQISNDTWARTPVL